MTGAKTRAGTVGDTRVKRYAHNFDASCVLLCFDVAQSGEQSIGGFTTKARNQCRIDRADVTALFNAGDF